MTPLLLVTTVVRHAGQKEVSGLVSVLDRESGVLIARTTMRESAYRDRESNPRGGVRGARGAAVWGDRLALANNDGLILLDHRWKVVGEISHRLIGGIHDIAADANGIWVTSTAADLLVRVDWSGNVQRVWDWRRERTLMHRLGHYWLPRGPGEIDHRDPAATRDRVSNVAHINAVAPLSDGSALVSLGRVLPLATYVRRRARGLRNQLMTILGREIKREPMDTTRKQGVHAPLAGCRAAIVRITETTVELVLERSPTTVPNHNIVRVDDWLVFNDTNNHRLTAISLTTQKEIRSIAIPGGPPFARGLAHLEGKRFLVGSQLPATVYEVDLEREKIMRSYAVNSMDNESVYSIVVMPPDFTVPTELRL
jgi:hypothetical protein